MSVAAVMYFKLSAKELEILAERDTVLKRLADNQVGQINMITRYLKTGQGDASGWKIGLVVLG